MHLQKCINTIYKKHPKKPIVISSLLDSILLIARPKVHQAKINSVCSFFSMGSNQLLLVTIQIEVKKRKLGFNILKRV